MVLCLLLVGARKKEGMTSRMVALGNGSSSEHIHRPWPINYQQPPWRCDGGVVELWRMCDGVVGS